MKRKSRTIAIVILVVFGIIALYTGIIWHDELEHNSSVDAIAENDVEDDFIEEKIIYLTFDDGPTEYTTALLELLDKYDVKVTFFVTNQYPEYQDLIGEAYRRGHEIGLHSYSHDYNIYSCEESYYQDLQLINDVVIGQTGNSAKIVRFPGGSSNCVSWSYCTGIMTCLAEGMEEHGYKYCDWNVDSLDSHGYLSAEEIARTAIAGIKKTDPAIVLMHDIEQCNIDAAEKIICWGLENGYKFLPMSEDMEMVHHSIVN